MSKSPQPENEENSFIHRDGSLRPEPQIDSSLLQDLDPALSLTIEHLNDGNSARSAPIEPEELKELKEPEEPLDTETDIKIPLRCDLCPNGVTFSDTSHLLTHMNSKSHIFHHWNLELFKEVNPRIRTALQDFQEFWEKYDLAGRIRTRMIKRNQIPRIASEEEVQAAVSELEPLKSTKSRRKSRKSRKPSQLSAGVIPEQTNLPANTVFEHDDFKDSIDVDSPYNIYEQPGFHNGESGQPLISWHQRPPFHTHQAIAGSPRSLYSPHQETHVTEVTDYFSMSVGAHRNPAVQSAFGDNASELETKYDPSEDGRSFKSEDTTSQAPYKKQEDFRPKGLQFAGMGGFDAAGNDQKRKRNQRKDPDVLIQLEASSERVTKDEFVFDLQLNLQRIRQVDIESDLSDDDEVHVSLAKKPRRRVSTTKTSETGKKPRARSIKQQIIHKSETKSLAPRARRASAQKAEAAIIKQHQQYSVTTSVEKSSLDSRPSSAQSIVPNSHSTISVKHESRASPDIAGQLTSSSSGINSLRATPDQNTLRQAGQGGLGPRANSPWLSIKSTNQNMAVPVTYTENKATITALQPGKENNPNVFYGRSHSGPYLTATHATRASSVYNPLFVQDGQEGAPALGSSYADSMNPVTYPGLSPINRSAPYPLMHMPRLGGLDQENNPSNSGFNF